MKAAKWKALLEDDKPRHSERDGRRSRTGLEEGRPGSSERDGRRSRTGLEEGRPGHVEGDGRRNRMGALLHRVAMAVVRPSILLNLVGACCFIWGRRPSPPPDAAWADMALPVSAFSMESGYVERHPPPDQWTIDTWTTFPGAGFCGSWATDYKKLHERMRRGEVPAKWVTNWPLVSGLGDMLNGVVTTFVAGLVSNRSFILMDSALNVVLEPGEIDWRVTKDINTNVDTTLRQQIKENGRTVFNLRRLNKPMPDCCVEWPKETLEYMRLLVHAENVVTTTNGGILARIFAQKGESYRALHAMGLRMPYAYGCILRYVFKTKPEVLKFLRGPMAELHVASTADGSPPTALAPSPSADGAAPGGITHPPAVFPNAQRPAVCVHIRTDDGFAFDGGDKAGGVSELIHFADAILDCAKNLSEAWLAPGVEPHLLFLSDSIPLVDAVQKKHGNKIMRSTHVPKHVAQHPEPAMFSTYADFLLFSTCELYVITESGFSKAAAGYNVNRPRRILLPFRWHDYGLPAGACRPFAHHSLLDFRTRSGF